MAKQKLVKLYSSQISNKTSNVVFYVFLFTNQSPSHVNFQLPPNKRNYCLGPRVDWAGTKPN
uniref:Uncharacterized protein n=1 Tax=Rhizophora mucronata TaxID=61149 RepID=A0A2P2QXB6_RHIMU